MKAKRINESIHDILRPKNEEDILDSLVNLDDPEKQFDIAYSLGKTDIAKEAVTKIENDNERLKRLVKLKDFEFFKKNISLKDLYPRLVYYLNNLDFNKPFERKVLHFLYTSPEFDEWRNSTSTNIVKLFRKMDYNFGDKNKVLMAKDQFYPMLKGVNKQHFDKFVNLNLGTKKGLKLMMLLKYVDENQPVRRGDLERTMYEITYGENKYRKERNAGFGSTNISNQYADYFTKDEKHNYYLSEIGKKKLQRLKDKFDYERFF